MTTPIVNSNGTSREALSDERIDAIRAIHAAREALCAITIHGRDYPDADSRYRDALNARDRVLLALREEETRLTHEVVALRRNLAGYPA